MRFSRLQVTIGILGSGILLFLLLYPEWQQASRKMPPEFRKEIGRGFLWSPPKTVSVGCDFIFTDCVETSATAFYPVVNRKLVLMQSVPLAIVTLLLLLIARSDKDGHARILSSTRTRMAISFLLALPIPPLGGIPFAVYLVLLPKIIFEHGDLGWQLYAIGIPVLFVVVGFTIFGLLSGIQLFTKRATRILGE
jgi:hypothetical protein